MKSAPARVSSSLAAAFRRLSAAIRQHPVLFAALLPVLVLASLIAYVVILIPLTPNVADIRKFQAEQPSVRKHGLVFERDQRHRFRCIKSFGKRLCREKRNAAFSGLCKEYSPHHPGNPAIDQGTRQARVELKQEQPDRLGVLDLPDVRLFRNECLA